MPAKPKKVPAKLLAHIAPHLRCFAVEARTLKRDSRNARAHTDFDIKSTAASLRRFGQQELIQYEPRTRTIKVGNGRFEAATSAEHGLEWEYLAAVPSDLSPVKLKAFALAHNRTGERAGWLDAELDRQLQELADTDDFDHGVLADLGFEKEIERLAAELDAELNEPTGDDESDGEAEELDEAGHEEQTFEPVGADTQARLDEPKPVTCPECGHRFDPRGK